MGQCEAMEVDLVVKVVDGERPVDIPLFGITNLDEDGDSLNEDLLIEDKEDVTVENNVISGGSDVIGENERVGELHFDCELERDIIKEDMRKDQVKYLVSFRKGTPLRQSFALLS